MKKNRFLIYILLMFTTGFICLADIMLRTLITAYITPKIDLPLIVLIVLVPMILGDYLQPEGKQSSPLSGLLAGIIITALMLCAGVDMGMPVWKFFIAAAVVWYLIERVYMPMIQKAPMINGFMLYLAAQCFQGFV